MINGEQLLEDDMKIIQLISSGAQLDQVLFKVIKSMEKRFGLSKISATIMHFDSTKNKLINLACSSLSSRFEKPIRHIKVGPFEGASGSAAFFKKSIIISDIENDTRWDKYRDIAERYGLKTSWSMPIISSTKELLGVFSIYYQTKFEPDMKTVRMIEGYQQLVGIALELSNNHQQNSTEKRHSSQAKETKQVEHEKVLSQLKRALSNEEFELYYQPYFGITTKEVGMEALIRWNHPDHGLLPPAAFLDVAESTGFILDMEEWVLNRSIDEAKKLKNKGLHNLSLSINVSAIQFENEDFPKMVADTLEIQSFQPELLTIEVTERFLVKQRNIEILKALKKIGVRISIDDFGTSYSSLQYLKDLPIDELKIDRSFIADIAPNSHNSKIVEMIIMLGHQLNLTIVGEGVETKDQFQLLKRMNCDRVQGFLFSKPLPLEKFEQKMIETDLF